MEGRFSNFLRRIGIERGVGDVWMLPVILVGFIVMVAFPTAWTWIMRAVIVGIGVVLFRLVLDVARGIRGRSFSIGPIGLVILSVWSALWMAYLVKLGGRGKWIEIALTAPVLILLGMLFVLNQKRPKLHEREGVIERDD